MGGGKDTLVGRTDVILDGDGPIYVSFGAALNIEQLAILLSPPKPRCVPSYLLFRTHVEL